MLHQAPVPAPRDRSAARRDDDRRVRQQRLQRRRLGLAERRFPLGLEDRGDGRTFPRRGLDQLIRVKKLVFQGGADEFSDGGLAAVGGGMIFCLFVLKLI